MTPHQQPRSRPSRQFKLHKDPRPSGRTDRGRNYKGREVRVEAQAPRDRTAQAHVAPRTPVRGPKRSRPRSSGSPEGEPKTRNERDKGAAVSEPEKVRVTMRPRPARRTEAHLIAVTKNNQGDEGQAAYCLAAVRLNTTGPARLIRLVPGNGHFWNEETLPEQLRDIHGKSAEGVPWEPQWQFRPVLVSFEQGSLPDAVTGPHRQDDVVSRNLSFVEPLQDNDELDDQLFRISYDKMEDVWPKMHWATRKSLQPEAPVTSLAVFRGRITWIEWRQGASPRLHLMIGDTEIPEVPYAAHRLQDDKGAKALEWLRDHGPCMLLLGLSRTFVTSNGKPQCPILLLRVFPG